MNTPPEKRPVLIVDSKTGKSRFSEPLPVHTARPISQETTSEIQKFETDSHSLMLTVKPASMADEAAAVQDDAKYISVKLSSHSPIAEDGINSILPSKNSDGPSKARTEIESLNQFVTYAYGRKGQRVVWKTKYEHRIAQHLHLSDEELGYLQTLVDADVLLVVPRQLLLVSLEVQGLPAVRAALSSFVSDLVFQHSIFSSSGVQAALHNLPDAPSMLHALSTLTSWEPVDEASKGRLKRSDLQALRSNAAHLLVTWFACNRGLNSDAVVNLLFNAMWAPAAGELLGDNSRLRALTDIEQPAGVWVACHRFRQQSTEARSAQDQARQEAESAWQKMIELEAQLQLVKLERNQLEAELLALQRSSSEELISLRNQHEAERMHLRHDLEQLRGRLVRRLDDSVEMLEVGLTALRNKTPRTEVMSERAEHVVDALRAELTSLREE